MLQNLKALYGRKLGATDGAIGHVKDFYFDDQNWAVRYVVADTGSWLPGRLVLIAPHAFGRFHSDGKHLCVNLTRQQIEDCPSIESHKTVSRQYEEEYYRHYGWPFYWQGSALWGMSGFPVSALPDEMLLAGQDAPVSPEPEIADAHLRNTQALRDYHVAAGEKSIGHIHDFLMDSQNWAITHLVVKTGVWLPGKEIHIPVSHVIRISYETSTVLI